MSNQDILAGMQIAYMISVMCITFSAITRSIRRGNNNKSKVLQESK